MLVLTRKVGQKIIIGCGSDTVVITLMEAGRGRARLTFEAPKRIAIDREEVWAKRDAKKEAK